MSHVSFDYYKIRNYEKAIEICENLLPKMEEYLGANDEMTKMSRFFLLDMYKFSSRFIDHEKFAKELIQSCKELYGENSYETLFVQNELIYTYFQIGKFKEAQDLLEHILPISDRVLADDSLEGYDSLKVSILGNKSKYYIYMQQYQEALELCHILLQKEKDVESKIVTLIDMTICFRNLGDYSNALKYNLESLKLYDENSEKKSGKLVTILRLMADNYNSLGEDDKALKFAQEAFDLSQKIFGKEHQQTLNAMTTLSVCYTSCEEFEKALEIDKKIYEISKKLFGNDSLHTIGAMRGIALNYFFILNDHDSGIKLQKKILKECERIYGYKNLETSEAMRVLASFYLFNNNKNKAIELYQEVLNLRKEILSTNDSRITASISDLARLYNHSPEWRRAIPLYEEVINRYEDEEKFYGFLTDKEKMNIFSRKLSTYTDLALLYAMAEEYEQAFRTLERMKTRNLVDRYSEQLIKNSDILTEEEIKKLNKYRINVIKYDKMLENTIEADGNKNNRFNIETGLRNSMNDYKKYKEFLQNKYPKYKNMSESNKINIEIDKDIISDDTCFIEFMTKEFDDYNMILSFVLDNSGNIKTVAMDTKVNFFDNCQIYHDILAYPNIESLRQDNKYICKLSDDNYKIVSGRQKPAENAILINNNASLNELRQNLSA